MFGRKGEKLCQCTKKSLLKRKKLWLKKRKKLCVGATNATMES
jgi:hypothetical protein